MSIPALQRYSRYEDTVTALDTISFPDVQPQCLSWPLHNLNETRARVGVLNDRTQIPSLRKYLVIFRFTMYQRLQYSLDHLEFSENRWKTA